MATSSTSPSPTDEGLVPEGEPIRWWWAFRRPIHRDAFLAWLVVASVVIAVWPFLGVPPAWVPGGYRELAAGLIYRFAAAFFLLTCFAGSIRVALSMGPSRPEGRRRHRSTG